LTGQSTALSSIPVEKLGNSIHTANVGDAPAIDISETNIQPVTAAIYQVDGIVRRASSLQMTADAKVMLTMPQEVNA